MTWNLSIDKIIGTSTTSAAQWTVQGNHIAYTVSNGIVVATIDDESLLHKVTQQRFFCANNSLKPSPPVLGSDCILEPEEVCKDSFGYPKGGDPIIIHNREEDDFSGGSFDPNTPTPMGMGGTLATTSPSKFKKSRNISSLALSPNGRLLAVGESGHQPRILIYSLAPELDLTPIMQVFEHSFGIQHLQFSPDLKLLVSLGVVSDGFINVWKIGSSFISLLSLNKCTSLVNQIVWKNPLSFVTLGLRFIKIWHVEGNKVLKGRNVILGPLVNSNFVSGQAIDIEEIAVITSENQLVLLNTADTNLKYIDYNLKDPVSITGDSSSIWILSKDGTINHTPIDLLQISDEIPKPGLIKQSSSPLKMDSMKAHPDTIQEIINIVDLNNDYLVYLTGSKGIKLFNKNDKTVSNLTIPVIPNLAGLDQIEGGLKIMALAVSGEVKLINIENDDLQITDVFCFSQFIGNPSGIAFISDNELALGDKEGNLCFFKSISGSEYSLSQQFKAHSSAINEIVHLNVDGTSVIVSIGRDRMIQAFSKITDEWDLLQTLNLHNGNLTHLEVDRKYSRIYVGSLDRSLSVHSIVKNLEGEITVKLDKVISLRTAPIAVKLTDQDVIVSTNDRTLQIYNNKTCEYKRTLKLFNEKDSLLIEEMLVLDQQIIVSSSDRSVRVFNYSLGRPILTLWGQLDLRLFKGGEKSILGLNSEGCMIRYTFETQAIDEPIVATKVTRKIVPPVRKLTNSSISSSSDISNGSINLLPAESSSKKATPNSSPRLTGATIKRLEARGISPSSLVGSSSVGLGSTSRPSSRSSSPMKPSLNSQLSSASLKSPIKDKPILRSPGKSSIISLSPVFGDSRRMSSPSRTPISTSTIEVKSSSSIRTSRQATSSPCRPGSRGICINKPQIPVSRYLEVLDKIIESLGRGEIGDEDIPLFTLKIDHIKTIIDIYDTDGSDVEANNGKTAIKDSTQLLEDYSEKLMLMVKRKLDDLSFGPD
ncbi:uncharacterized protein KQ657_000556 [Scheffersomyces spartinae]|uniref:WD40 repeat-like protein n=1 Tax=Scheffersomyces spartinae TaxID=45513 RepID=A0A9P7V947_9ASCO|nr:uncharacterized protein KQ657_000556 [Scheffersomyces spartinae]KAG7193489.1 hypothetical protein KQ657_000556 [Scheffersomyces spartinae]